MMNAYLRLSNTERFEQLWMFNGQFNNFLNLFNLLLESTDHFVCRVWHLFYHHETHKWVDL